MSLLLNIDTAADIASVCLSENGEKIAIAFNEKKNDQAAWLHPAINDLLSKNGLSPKDLQAVAVSIGPGSYTGLRIGLSAAKGFCYALNIPLLTVNTLKLLAFAAQAEAVDLICPVIDARRMEVFTATYDKNLVEIKKAHSLIVNENSFQEFLIPHNVLFCGNGSTKIHQIIANDNAFFSNTVADTYHLAILAHSLFLKKDFADTAYTEPFYVKDFYSTV